jgi:Flp pilus assembly protein TadB
MKFLTLAAAGILFITAVVAFFSNPMVAALSFTASIAMVSTWVVHKRQSK